MWTNLTLRLKCLNESLQTHTLHWDILSPKKFTFAHKESGSQQEIPAVIDSTLLSIFNRVRQKFSFNHSFTQSSATACSVCARVCVNCTTPVWALLLLIMALTSAAFGWLCGWRRLPNEPVCREEKKILPVRKATLIFGFTLLDYAELGVTQVEDVQTVSFDPDNTGWKYINIYKG